MIERRALGTFDWALVAAMLTATGLGFLMLYSTTYLQGGDAFYRQLAWLSMAVVALVVVVAVDYRFWASLAIPAYAVMCAVLAVV
ncbi:MAG TPA: hypothetical protein VFG76_07810, partial [Candidatus Polarisedimenticolia bacterium]|nr:hypothetical protein [Candidatus Polarisedimenticolia bacterium]